MRGGVLVKVRGKYSFSLKCEANLVLLKRKESEE